MHSACRVVYFSVCLMCVSGEGSAASHPHNQSLSLISLEVCFWLARKMAVLQAKGRNETPLLHPQEHASRTSRLTELSQLMGEVRIMTRQVSIRAERVEY